jgi:transcription initiation factor IIF auxiliary subunit
MTFAVAQSEHYLGSKRWEWSAWIDATPEDLEQLNEVRWVLHPTFSPSTVVVTDHASKFMLSTSGWGTFLLRAELRFRQGGTAIELTHMLKLSHLPPCPPQPRAGLKTASRVHPARTAKSSRAYSYLILPKMNAAPA